MSGEKAGSVCNKFQANIFNKSKCQNCFKSRELHLLTDHEMDQAKPIYGGWLCLAPEGTDFDNPMQRSRKWQRRFFILYEHGSLTFALDDLPSTLPQGTVNMNLCVEVTDAEPKTGQKNSLWVVTPDQEIFIRGENKEIINGWSEQLTVYPRINKQNLKKKRKVDPITTQEPSPAKMAATDPCFTANKRAAKPGSGSGLWQESQAVLGQDMNPVWAVMGPDPLGSEQPRAGPTSRYLPLVSRERLASDSSWLSGGVGSSVSSLDSVAGDSVSPGSEIQPAELQPNNLHTSASNKNQRAEGSHHNQTGRLAGLEPVNLRVADAGQGVDQVPSRKGRSEARTNMREKLQSCGDAEKLSAAPLLQRRAKSLDRRTSESIMTPDLLNFKKGWMVQLDERDQWKKYWFVLSADSLRYYKDSIAEEASDLEGEIDLTKCYNVSEYQVQRNYGFQIHTQRGVYTLSAMTKGIRRNWIQALMKNVHPSNAPDVASLPSHHIVSSPHEDLPKPDVTRESLSKVLLETDQQPKSRGVLERRREGRYKTFDWAEFRPLVRPPGPDLDIKRMKEPCSSDTADLERRKRREERRRRYENVLGFPLACDVLGYYKPQDGTARTSSSQSQQRILEEIEQCWKKVESTAFKSGKTVPLSAEVQTTETAELERLLENYRKGIEDLNAQLAESNQRRLELEAQLTTAECRQQQVPPQLDHPLSPEDDFDPMKTSENPLTGSHAQSLRDMYRETKELLHQQDLIRQSMQEQLGLVQSVTGPQEQHSHGSQMPSILLHDTDGNIQKLGDLSPDCQVSVNTPLLSPVSDCHYSLLNSDKGTAGSNVDIGTANQQTHLDREIHKHAKNSEISMHSGEWSPKSLMMTNNASELRGDDLNCCESMRCAEDLIILDQARVRKLSQEVVLLTSQNEALNQRNQEMLNQLTEADREIERLKTKLVNRQASEPHQLPEAEHLNQTRAECLERELSKRNQELQEARCKITSLEEHLKDTEIRLQLREATLEGLGVPAVAEDEEENKDALYYGKKAEGYLLRCFEATEAKLTDLERQLQASELTCRELQAHNTELMEAERLYSQRAREAEADIWRLKEEIGSVKLKEGEKLPSSNLPNSSDERIQQVIKGMVARLKALGKLLEVIDTSYFRGIKGSIESGHEGDQAGVVGQLKWEKEFWEVMSERLKAVPFKLSEEKGVETLLSEVAEHMLAEKQMLLFTHALFSETDLCIDPGRGGEERYIRRASLEEVGVVGNTASENETENRSSDDNRRVTNVNHSETENESIRRELVESTQKRMSLLNHIASSVKTSANEALQVMAHRVCDFYWSQHPWSHFIHSAATEALYSCRISRLHSSHQRELEETKQRLLSSCLICSNCNRLMDENKELKARLLGLEKHLVPSASVEAETPPLSQGGIISLLDDSAKLHDVTNDQRANTPAAAITGEMEDKNPEQDRINKKEVQKLEAQEDIVQGDFTPKCTEIPILNGDSLRGTQGEITDENKDVANLDNEDAYTPVLEEVVQLHGKVKDLEEQLSVIADEMKAELEERMSSLQLQHEQDMEKLKSAYEQGFITMEESHKRGLQEQHSRQQRELERLEKDRDRLLEEETAATVTAIGAIKNAHRLELQREVQRICQSKNITGNADLEQICQQHSEELASLQQELEVLSQQYSLKCLENGHFAQALDAERRALCQCQQENQDLRTRNQELSGHLAAEITRLCSLAKQDALPLSQGMNVYELEITLRVKESEVQCLKQAITSLKDELQSVQMEKRLVTKKYNDIYTELTIIRTKAERDIGQLQENLRLAHKALGETSP